MAALNDDLGVQASYRFRVIDARGMAVSRAEFGGLDSTFVFRLPPQSLQVQRNIRADVVKDVTHGVSIVTGGEGIGRITIGGTHGVGLFVDADRPSSGRLFRENLSAFFQAFVNANDGRGRRGQENLHLLWEIVDGRWSNPEYEGYLVWPESFPTDSRAASRPHAWDWQCSLMLLRPWAIPRSVDPAKVVSVEQLCAEAKKHESALDKLMKFWKGTKAFLQKARDLKNKLGQIRDRIQTFAAGLRDFIYEVTDLIRGSAQLCTDILRALSVEDFLDDATNAVRGTIYEIRRMLGSAAITANQFKRAGMIPPTLTPPQLASLSRPVVVSLSREDSLQAIAARTMGDSSRWVDLVKANGLEYPYLDFSGPDGRPGAAYDGLRVLGARDTLKLPLPATPGIGVADDPIGTDIPDNPTSAGILVGGSENLVAALLRRIRTPRGHIPWHPLYGSALPSMVGSAQSLGGVAAIKGEAAQTFKADPRVLSVQALRASVDGTVVLLDGEVTTPLGPLTVAGAVS